MVLHHRLFRQPPAALTLATPLAARNLSPCSPLLSCNQVSPCDLAAFLWKLLHSGLLATKYHLVLSRRPPGNARTLTGSRYNCLVLSWHPSGDACILTSNVPLLLGCQHCWDAIVVGLPSLSGRHPCPAAIVIRLPLLLGCHHIWAAIIVGLLLPPRSLGLPPNGLFLLGYIVAPFS